MRILSYILSISLLSLLPLTGYAQQNTDEQKKEYNPWSFNGIGIQTDIFGYAYSMLEDYTSGEVAIEANIGNRFYPIVEAGLGWCNVTDETTSIKYKTNAPYFKVGLNYNFFTSKDKPNPDHYIFGLARVAWSTFEYDVTTPPITDPVWGGSSSLELKDVAGSCCWAEFGAGIKVKIYKGFHMGWSVRYKVRLSQKEGNNSNMWYVPGYGINKSTCFGGTYSLIYEFSL